LFRGKVVSDGADKLARDLGHTGQFEKRVEDNETGLYYYGYRYYSAELGRWLSRDPIGEQGGVNIYAYVFNSSVNAHDYQGTTPQGYITKKILNKALLPLYSRLISDLATKTITKNKNKSFIDRHCTGPDAYKVFHKHWLRTQIRFGTGVSTRLKLRMHNRTILNKKIPTNINQKTAWVNVKTVLILDWICIRCSCDEDLVVKGAQTWRNVQNKSKKHLSKQKAHIPLNYKDLKKHSPIPLPPKIGGVPISVSLELQAAPYREKRVEGQHTVFNFACQSY